MEITGGGVPAAQLQLIRILRMSHILPIFEGFSKCSKNLVEHSLFKSASQGSYAVFVASVGLGSLGTDLASESSLALQGMTYFL